MYKYLPRPKSQFQIFMSHYGSPLAIAAFGLALASFGFLGPASSDIDTNSRVFADGLNIHLDRGSPAFAALEDTWTPPRDLAPPAADRTPATEIGAGRIAADELAERIVRENRREASLKFQEKSSRENNSVAMAQIAAELLRKMTSGMVPREAVKTAGADVALEKNEITHTKTISLSELKMSREELLASMFLPIAQSSGASGESHREIAQAPPVRRAPRFVGEHETLDPVNEEPGGRVNARAVPSEDSTPRLPPQKQILISGNLEFTEGLALTNPMDRVVVYRESDGEMFEAGAVWLKEARYEIFVEESVGVLIGELRTPYGDVIGRGSFELSKLPKPNLAEGRRVVGVALAIKPTPPGLSGRVISGDVKDRNVKSVAVSVRDLGLDMITQKEGRFSKADIMEGSSVIIHASRPSFWGTIAVASTGHMNEIEILADRDGHIVSKLLASVGLGSKATNYAIIWGRALNKGQPVAGAHVELMTGGEDSRPVYFNSAGLPDPKLQETSNNGLYAFFPVTPGSHAVQVKYGSTRSEPMLFPAEEKHVSKVDVEILRDRSAKIKVFDAFQTDYPLAAEIKHLGMTKTFAISREGSREVKYASSQNLLIYDVYAGPAYEPVRLTLNRERRMILAPMVQSAWLQQLRGSLKINSEPSTGTVIGFVQGDQPFKAAISGLAAGTKIVYFNHRGDLSAAEYGEPGGGFVILNAPEGFRTITLQPSGSMKVYATVALVERGVNNIVSHWLR